MKSTKNNKGFTLVETLISLSVILLSTTIVFQVVKAMNRIEFNDYLSDDLIAIKQMRLLFATMQEIECDDEILYFLYHDEEGEIIVDQNKVYKTPGHEILIQNIEEGYFEEEDSCVYITIKRKSEKRYLLGCIE